MSTKFLSYLYSEFEVKHIRIPYCCNVVQMYIIYLLKLFWYFTYISPEFSTILMLMLYFSHKFVFLFENVLQVHLYLPFGSI